MPAPREELIMVAAQARLAGIVGDSGANYFHTADVVVRSPSFHGGLLQKLPDGTNPRTRYFMSPDRIDRSQHTNKEKKGLIRWDLTVAQRLDPNFNENPYTATRLRETIQAELAYDAEKRLISDTTYQAYQGLEVWNVEVTLDDRSAEETNIEGWACAFLRVVISYKYFVTNP